MTDRPSDDVQKVVICGAYGGFGLSREAFLKLREMGNAEALEETDYGEFWSDGSGPREKSALGDNFLSGIKRDDPDLVRVVEEMGQEAAGRFCKLVIVDVPADAEWEIEEYDGLEHVAEKHRTWS